MKFLLCLGVLCALAVQPAAAQVARYYNLFNLSDTATNDLTATLPAGTTNKIVLLSGTVTNQWGSPSSAITITASNIVVRCQDFDKCGFTYQSVGVAGSTNGVFGVQIFGSTSKGAVWDTAPRWNFTTTNAAPNGATTFTIVTNLDLSGIDRLAFVFLNGTSAPATNAWTGYQTNVIAGIRLKATKVLTLTESD